jgi:hypothetical protein
LKLSRDYELLKCLVAKRSAANKQVRKLLHSLHLYKSQVSVVKEKRKPAQRLVYEDTTAVDAEYAEAKRRVEASKSMVISLKEEMVFANLKSTELTQEIQDLKARHADHMQALHADLDCQREKWRKAEADVSQSCLDYKLKANQGAKLLEDEQAENERALAQIKQEIEIAQGLVKGNSRGHTFYSTLKEFVAAGVEAQVNSRPSSMSSRIRTTLVRGLSPKKEKIPSIRLNSSFSIRSRG